MRLLNKLWLLAIGVGIGSLWVLTIETYAGKLSMFLIVMTLIVILGGLTLYTVKFRKPHKKKMPVRRGSRLVATSRRGKMKVVAK